MDEDACTAKLADAFARKICDGDEGDGEYGTIVSSHSTCIPTWHCERVLRRLYSRRAGRGGGSGASALDAARRKKFPKEREWFGIVTMFARRGLLESRLLVEANFLSATRRYLARDDVK